MSGLGWLGLLLALMGLMMEPVAARAAVRFDVFLGYDNVISEARWFPVVCEVYNDGPAFNAVFELAGAGPGEGQVRQLALELPTGTTKRFVVPVFCATRYRSTWDARLRDEKGRVRAEALNLQPRLQLPWTGAVLGALSRTVGGSPTLAEAGRRPGETQSAVARLNPNLFPDHPIALEGLDAIYLHAEKALDLKAGQVNALLAWLHGGGHLIVGVEQILHVNGNEWLRALLPCELTGVTTLTGHAEIQQWLQSDRGPDGRTWRPRQLGGVTPRPQRGMPPQAVPATKPVNPFATVPLDAAFEQAPLHVATGTLRDGTVLFGPAETPLAILARRGRGQVTVLTFSPELEPFLSWANRRHFWSKLIGAEPDAPSASAPSHHGSFSIDSLFGAMLDSRQVRKLPVVWLLVLLAGYLVVIGPLDRIWLKRMKREMLTWVTFPLYVACFSSLIYLIGYKLRAGVTEWNELQVVDIIPIGGQAQWRGRTYGSIYSPVNARYRLASDQPVATLRGEYLRRQQGGQEASQAVVRQQANSFAAEVPVPVWVSQLYTSDWLRRDEAPLSLAVSGAGSSRSAQVMNQSDRPLAKAWLVVEDRIWELGELPARQSRSVALTPNTGGSLSEFMSRQRDQLHRAAQTRLYAFGQTVFLDDLAASVTAASFTSLLREPISPHHGSDSLTFIAPPGLDLGELVKQGYAVLLAWMPEHAPSRPLNEFNARRAQHAAFLRLAIPPSDLSLEK